MDEKTLEEIEVPQITRRQLRELREAESLKPVTRRELRKAREKSNPTTTAKLSPIISDPIPSKIQRKKRILKFLIPLSVLVAVFIGVLYVATVSVTVPVAPSNHTQESDKNPCIEFSEGFLNCKVEFIPNDGIARDKLVSQSVDPGFTLSAPDTITLSYSAGPISAKFPDLVKKSYDDAVRELYVLGIGIGDVKVVDSPDLESNRVISTSIKPGTKVKNGSKVTLEVSSEIVDIPDVKGKTSEQAQLDLEKLGVTLKIEEKLSSDPQGTVIGQVPAAGKVDKDSVVTITVAKLEEVKNIKVPIVVGLKEGEAQGLIAAAGFKNIAVVRIESSKAKEPLVSHVVPGEGVTIKSDSNIVLIVSTPEAK